MYNVCSRVHACLYKGYLIDLQAFTHQWIFNLQPTNSLHAVSCLCLFYCSNNNSHLLLSFFLQARLHIVQWTWFPLLWYFYSIYQAKFITTLALFMELEAFETSSLLLPLLPYNHWCSHQRLIKRFCEMETSWKFTYMYNCWYLFPFMVW